MARDVEFNVTAADKTGTALAKAEAKFKETQRRILAESQKTNDKVGKGLEESVTKAAPKMASGFARIGVTGGGLLVSGIAAAAPVIGATLSAAVIGGAGIGGVLGGVALAARDPQVKAAGAALGKNLLGDLEQSAQKSFVAPTLEAIQQVQAGFDGMSGRLDRIFANSAKFLKPLTAGVLAGTDGILRGVEQLVAKGGPVIDAFSDTFDQLGNAVGDALTTISGDSEDAAAGLRLVADALSVTIEGAGWAVRGLTELFGWLKTIGEWSGGNIRRNMLGISDSTGEVGDIARRVATDTGVLANSVAVENDAVALVTPNLQSMAAATRAVYTANNNLYSSETAAAEAIATATEKIKENGRTLSLNSDKGRENRDAVSSVAGALQKQYDGYVAVNGVGPKSAALADTLRGRFVALAEKAGLSAGKARDLANELLDIPSSRETKLTVHNEQALEAARETRRALEAVHSKTVTLRVNRLGEKLYGNQASNYAAGGSFFRGAASDGMTRTGGAAQVELSSNISVFLDGQPFYAASARSSKAAADRQAWRTKVGTR